jgi:hypothetical protein
MANQATTVSYEKAFLTGPKKGHRQHLKQDFPSLHLAECWIRQVTQLCREQNDNPLTYTFENFEIVNEQ